MNNPAGFTPTGSLEDAQVKDLNHWEDESNPFLTEGF